MRRSKGKSERVEEKEGEGGRERVRGWKIKRDREGKRERERDRKMERKRERVEQTSI